MLIPKETSFLLVCKEHDWILRGQPTLVHPNLHATAVWSFDLEHDKGLRCDHNDQCENPDNNLWAACRPTWEVRA